MENKEPQQIQINLDPNIYTVTNANIVSDEELFHIMLMSGSQGRQFAATPKHTKRIYLLLKQQIEAYEKQFGELKTELPKVNPNTPSTQNETKVGF